MTEIAANQPLATDLIDNSSKTLLRLCVCVCVCEISQITA